MGTETKGRKINHYVLVIERGFRKKRARGKTDLPSFIHGLLFLTHPCG